MLSTIFEFIGMMALGVVIILAILSYIGALVMGYDLDDGGIVFGIGWGGDDEYL